MYTRIVRKDLEASFVDGLKRLSIEPCGGSTLTNNIKLGVGSKD